MVPFLLFVLAISVVLVFSVVIHLSISSVRNHKRHVKHQRHLHDVIFSHAEEDDDNRAWLTGAGAF